MSAPRPLTITHVSEIEGGRWVPWVEWRARPVPGPQGKRIHAWKLSDGTVWDAYGGLCPESMWEKPVDGTGWAEAAFVDDVKPSQREEIQRQRNDHEQMIRQFKEKQLSTRCIYGNEDCRVCS